MRPKHRKKKGNQWADHYTRKAKEDRYPARSVYKLQEMQKKFRLIAKGDRVLDLGCAPGSWTLYAAELTGGGGSVAGIDLTKVEIPLPSHAKTYEGDILDMGEDLSSAIGADYNMVLSDMAPKTTGMKDVDALRSLGLCEMALEVAKERLVPGGGFVCKIFQGGDFKAFTDSVKAHFKACKIFKPESCRKASKEIYIIGIDKK